MLELKETQDPAEKTLVQQEPLGTRIARRFAGLGLNEPLPELRGQLARLEEFED